MCVDSFLFVINSQDPMWIAIAFICGLLVKLVGLPPLIGFLVAGFVLNAGGAQSGVFLQGVADLGITLLLFTIGLKLKLKTLVRSEVWGVATLHMGTITLLFAGFVLILAQLGLPLFRDLDLPTALLIGFALSFSSTVFAVKILDALGATGSRHGRTSIGVLIVQDIAAVMFLALSTGKVPSLWALGLLLLIPLRHVLHWILDHTDHGEMLVLYGIVLALGGSDLFEMVGMKADLGALVFGMLLTSHPKATELSRILMNFKDLFLVGFFLSIGMSAMPGWAEVLAAVLLLLVLPIKVALYYGLFSGFKLRARATWQSSLNLANYSEFGLIVGALAAANGLLPQEWLAVFAIALAASFIIAAPLATSGDTIYSSWRDRLKQFERTRRLHDDEDLNALDVEVMVIGMGRMGTSAYKAFSESYPGKVLGIDLDADKVHAHQAAGLNVMVADGTNPDLWSQAQGLPRQLKWAVLCLPSHQANIQAARRLKMNEAQCQIAATTKFVDEADELRAEGVDFVFNIYAEACAGFANDLRKRFAVPLTAEG